MDSLENKDGRKLELLTTVVNFSIQQRWITENEWLQIKAVSTVNELERSLYQFMTNVKSDDTASKLLCAISCINETDASSDSVYNEHHVVSMIMSKLLKKSLVTEEEKLVFERKLEMANNVNETGKEEMNCDCDGRIICVPETRERTGSEVELIRNPLEHPPVIKLVFQYLKNEDVKNLRLISKEWSSAGLGILFTRSKIKLDSPKDMSNFLKLFSKTSYEMIPFRKFAILGEIEDEDEMWTVDELGEFFKKQGKYITELEFKNLQLLDSRWKQQLKTWNITPWISNCAMVEQTKSKCHSKLSVSREDEEESMDISVDLSALVCIKELSLKNVTVNLQDGFRISPTKLKLSEVTFMKDGEKVAELHLNDIVDFSKATLTHVSLESFISGARLSFKLYGNGKLDHFKLLNVPLLNMETCCWEVNKLTTCNLTFPEQSQMKIKNLNMRSYGDALYISDLPAYIEKLSLVGVIKETFLYNEPVVLKYIKFLHLILMGNVLPLFTQNLIFPNLTHLYLENSFQFRVDEKLDLAWISKTIKVIQLNRVKIINTGNDGLSLDRLILKNAEHFNIEEFCSSHVTTNELVLDLSWQYFRTWIFSQLIVDILEHQNVCRNCVQRFYIGPFFWTKYDFDSSPLRFYLNRTSRYYLIENQKGIAIEEKEFNSLMDLN